MQHYLEPMTRRTSLILLLGGAGFVLFALSAAVAFDFERYVVLDGFEASHWTWLLVVLGGALALLGLFLRKNITMIAAITNGIAAACVTVAIVLTVRATPHRVERTANVVDCSNQNIQIGCRLHQLLDALEPAPPAAAPSRALLVAALGTYALICGTVLIRTAREHRPNTRPA